MGEKVKKAKKKQGITKLSNGNKSAISPISVLLTCLVATISILLALPYLKSIGLKFPVTNEFRASEFSLLP
jgi:uncharacterized protein YybS (DUF2232 family)